MLRFSNDDNSDNKNLPLAGAADRKRIVAAGRPDCADRDARQTGLRQARRTGTIGPTKKWGGRIMAKTPDYFAGKTIVITGAASGIGRATALIFAREGANVVCADIDEAGARGTAAAINAKGNQALAVKIDVTSRAQVDDLAARAITAFGSVQFLFNSAGAALRRSKFLDIDDALLAKTFALNVNGTLYAMQAVLPHMLKNKFGVIVNMASMAHRRGGPGSSVHYAAAKGAVVSMTLGVAREFATQGIRALSISPGPIKTPFQDAAGSSPELVRRFLDDVPMQRFGEPEEIGELVLFMCSDACPFMTADTVYVNGGGGWR
jgi:3-oxoacyl-[acyl-carrier protein] reductase